MLDLAVKYSAEKTPFTCFILRQITDIPLTPF